MTFGLYKQKQPDYLNLEEQRKKIQAAGDTSTFNITPQSQTSSAPKQQDVDPTELYNIFNEGIKKPEYDQKRQDIRKKQSAYSAFGRGLLNVGDSMSLGLGGRVPRREKQPQYIEDYMKYRDDYSNRLQDWEYKDYVSRLNAANSISGQKNKDRDFEYSKFRDNVTDNRLGERDTAADSKWDRSAGQGDRRQTEVERHNKVMEGLRNGNKSEPQWPDTEEGRKMQQAYGMARKDNDFLKSRAQLFEREVLGDPTETKTRDPNTGKSITSKDYNYNYVPAKDITPTMIIQEYLQYLKEKDYIGSNRGDSGMQFQQPRDNQQASPAQSKYSTGGYY